MYRPGFYLTFWQLSTYDLAPPAVRYEEEGVQLRSLSRQEDTKYTIVGRSSNRTKRQGAQAHRPKRDRYWHRSSRPRQHRDGIRSSGWRRRRLIGSRMARRLRHWCLLLSNIAFSRIARCRLWTRTIGPKSPRRFTSWAPRALAR